jgi:hypothetical protein
MKNKTKKNKRIGQMTNSRGTWTINPITKVKDDDTKYNRKKEKKNWRYDE